MATQSHLKTQWTPKDITIVISIGNEERLAVFGGSGENGDYLDSVETLKSPLNNLILATLWCEPNLIDTNWEKSKWTCIYKSKQILYRYKTNLLIQERILSQNQLSLPHITVLPDEKVI